MDRIPRIVLIMPALDEAAALPLVLGDLKRVQAADPSVRLAEIIVVDNGSTDATASVAAAAGATVLQEPQRGYGAACLRALAILHRDPPDIVVFMDADHSDDAADLPALVRPLIADGFDLVIGSRVRGTREPGALTPQARWGNWLATRLIRARFGFRYTDLGPFRAVRFRTLEAMRLTDRDFGWTIEMQIRALQVGARVTEVPVRYRRRVGRSKISGTVVGAFRAGVKILATFGRLAWLPLVLVGATLPPAACALDGVVPATAAPVASHFDHGAWDSLLTQSVDPQGRVAYRTLQARGRERLTAYLGALASAHPETWPRDEQLAFWINAYNAGMVDAVLRGQSPEAEAGRAAVFKNWMFRVAGKDRTLDEIEHEILRPRFQEPRVHFTIVCAATSCPKLRQHAYRPDSLEVELASQARRFVNDATRNQFDRAGGKMRLSPIFDWFRADFEQRGTLRKFLATYVDDAAVRQWLLSDAVIATEFLDYDWTLNAQPDQRPQPPRR